MLVAAVSGHAMPACACVWCGACMLLLPSMGYCLSVLCLHVMGAMIGWNTCNIEAWFSPTEDTLKYALMDSLYFGRVKRPCLSLSDFASADFLFKRDSCISVFCQNAC